MSCEDSSGPRFPEDQPPQPGLLFGDTVGDPHLVRQGRQEATNSLGSTLCAITKSRAFFFSTKLLTILTPARRTSPLPAAFFSAWASSLTFFSCFAIFPTLVGTLKQPDSCFSDLNHRRCFEPLIEDESCCCSRSWRGLSWGESLDQCFLGFSSEDLPPFWPPPS